MAAPTLGSNWQTTLRLLENGWDSYNGKPITAAAIETVERFAVVPCSSGGLQLEVHRRHLGIEIEIGPDGRIMGALFEVQPPGREEKK
jgi:hypothetical protein